jgi:hypothetical protein
LSFFCVLFALCGKFDVTPTGSPIAMPIPKGRYRHFKGQLYEVLEVARHSETEEWFVVYRQLYGDGGIWIRPLAMFCDILERNGRTVARFTPVDDDPC